MLPRRHILTPTGPIRNELIRLKPNFFDIPARVYCEVTTGTWPEDPTIILPWIYPGLLDHEEFKCTEEFIRLLSDNYEAGDQRRAASAIADVFDGFYSAQDKIIGAIREQSEKKVEQCT